jgi:hypothetical protein
VQWQDTIAWQAVEREKKRLKSTTSLSTKFPLSVFVLQSAFIYTLLKAGTCLTDKGETI